MRKVYCDCCKREIQGQEQLFSMIISKWQDREIVLDDVCVDCYERIKHIVDNAEVWRTC